MTDHSVGSGAISREALRWTDLLPHANEMEQGAFADWVLRSPQHLKAFLVHKALGTELQALDPERRIDIEILLARCRTTSAVALTSFDFVPVPATLSSCPAKHPS
jgi:ferric-dicitrate binding protein FerR (iron transport regulator)